MTEKRPVMENDYYLIVLISLLLCFVMGELSAEVIRVKDDTGRTIQLDKSAQRIITLAPHAVELIFAAGGGERIIGTVSYSDFPEQAKSIPLIGSYTAVDVERILALKPDLIIAWQSGNRKNEIDKLIQLGLNVFINEPRSIDDVANSIERFGKLLGTETIANRFSKNFRQHYHALQTRWQGRKKVRMFYQIWNDPLITVNDQHLISAVMRLCGAENVFRDMPALSAGVSVEAVIAAKPQIIIAGGDAAEKAHWMDVWRRWTNLPAVKYEQLYFVDSGLIHRHGPRILDGAEIMCRYVDQARKAIWR